MNLNHATNKANGSTLSATEWNNLAADVNELGAGGAGNNASSSYFYMNDKGNLCIETTAENTPSGKKGKINIESNDDIQIKPSDDIMLYADHREGKTDEVSIKVMNGEGSSDVPVKLQINASELTVTTKDKTGNDANIFDVNVNSGKNTKGYLKVRAQAIDLRCEANGGIALQPKGEDGDGHENKIKFEHNGGDGLEFGTFNTLKTSLYTNEYRFNANGSVYAALRPNPETTYKIPGDPTSGIKKIDYPTQADDFKDVIYYDQSCSWKDIVRIGKLCEERISPYSIKLLENSLIVKAAKVWKVVKVETPSDLSTVAGSITDFPYYDAYKTSYYLNLNEAAMCYCSAGQYYAFDQVGEINENETIIFSYTIDGETKYYSVTRYDAKIDLLAEGDILISSNNGSVNFGESTITGGPSNNQITCSVKDIIKLVNWMKTNNEGPWASQL